MNGMQNARMGGTWHSSYSMVDRQKVVQILAATLKEIQTTNYNEQKALAMAQEFEKYTFSKSASKEEYLNIIKQKVTQLRLGMRNAAAATQNQQSAASGNVVPSSSGSGASAGTDFAGQNMAMYAQNRQQGQQSQVQGHQRSTSVSNTSSQSSQNTQQMPQGLQPTQQQIQQIGQMIRTSPIPPALLNKLPSLPPNVNTWTRIYECLQKKIIPTSAMPIIKEVHNAHFQLAVRQHQQQKLTQMRRANGSNAVDNLSTSGNGAGSFGPNTAQSVNGVNMDGIGSARNANAANAANAKAKLNSRGGAPNYGNMATINSMPNTNGMNNMANMNNMNNMGGVNMNGMNNMGQMNNMNGVSNMNNAGIVNNPNNMNGMGSMNLNMQAQGNTMNMQNSPQIPNQSTFRSNQIHTSQSQPQQSMQAPMGMQNQSQSAPPHQQQQQQVKVPNFQITSQDLVKYSAEAMALLNKLQQNGSIQPNLDPAQKQNFVRKFISHQKLNAWKAQQNNTGQSSGMGQQEQQQQMQRQQQLNPTSSGGNGYIQQTPQSMHSAAGPNIQLQSPTVQQIGQPNVNPMMGQNPASSAQPRSLSAQGIGADPVAANNVVPQRMTPGPMASVMPVLTDEMKMKLRSLFEEVARNSVHLKDVTMLLSEKEKLEVKESMAKITQQYSNIDSILSYYYVLTRNIEGTKRLIQMKNMTKNIIDNLQIGVYLAGPDLLEKIRIQYQKHLDFVKEELMRRRTQQARSQSQNQPISAPAQSQQVRQAGQYPNQQFASHGAMQQPMPQNYNGMLQGLPINATAQQQPQQHQQQYARNNPNVLVQPQRAGPSAGAAQVVGSSPAVPLTVSSPAQGSGKGQKAPKKPAAAKRKAAKAGTALPTPVANAATPATLANAIKTPTSISTPQIPTSQSAKGTPNASSPQANGKSSSTSDIVASTGDIFGASNVDKKLMKRRELSKSDPEQFFFAALSNMLKLDPDSAGGEEKVKEVKKGIRSPLSPLSSGEWTCDIKPQAVTSAFRQVEFIAELTSCDVLQVCADLATDELQEKDKASELKRKREAEDDEDMDMLFEDKKSKVDDDMEKRLFAPIELDDWKSWLGGLQQT
ncbi:hypothetical protein OXX79_000585 [Metschnikowia pulcherrima]